MATLVSTQYLSPIPLVSRVGLDARVLTLNPMDFALDSEYQIDITAVVQAAQLVHPIQSMFVDASDIPYGSTVIQLFGSGQRIVVPPQTEGYYPLLLTRGSYVFTLTNGSNLGVPVGAPLRVFFMNVPYVQSQWSTVAASGASGGYGVGPLGGNPLGS